MYVHTYNMYVCMNVCNIMSVHVYYIHSYIHAYITYIHTYIHICVYVWGPAIMRRKASKEAGDSLRSARS